MGIDYNANYGIGYAVSEGANLSEEDLEDGLYDYLQNNQEASFDSFETNEGYDGEVTGIYLTIEEPFRGGLDLTEAKNLLDEEMGRLGVEPESGFGAVGGMYIY